MLFLEKRTTKNNSKLCIDHRQKDIFQDVGEWK